jgi:hypothetical protein
MMIERPARTLARLKADWQYGSATKDADRDDWERHWQDSIGDASVVLAAMREPSEAMLEVSCDKHKTGQLNQYGRECSRIQRNRTLWGKMLNAALSPRDGKE